LGGNGFVDGITDQDKSDSWSYTPAGLGNAPCVIGTRGECLFVASDATNDIVAISWVSPGGEGTY